MTIERLIHQPLKASQNPKELFCPCALIFVKFAEESQRDITTKYPHAMDASRSSVELSLKKQSFECPFENNCLIQMQLHKKQKRRNCRSCRFKKCVEVGMNPLAIVTVSGDHDPSIGRVISSNRLVFIDERMDSMLEDLFYTENRFQSLRMSIHNLQPGLTIECLLNKFSLMGTSFPEMPSISNKSTSSRKIECQLSKRDPLDYSRSPRTFHFWYYMDMVYHVAWISSFDFFNDLDRADQNVIVRKTTLELMTLTTSYFSYMNKSSSCMFPDGMVFNWSDNSFDVIRNCFEINLIDTEQILLKILLLCNPTWEQLSSSSREKLSGVRKKYTNILMKFCMNKYGRTEGATRMVTIIHLMNTIIHKTSKARSFMMMLSIMRLHISSEKLSDQICGIDEL
ncbi:hypothetical protein PRIPAC_77826 [Pristionchus pacificus]|nr:hypothetical protein PRIPAC_77826 [Pristionchus pacificus]